MARGGPHRPRRLSLGVQEGHCLSGSTCRILVLHSSCKIGASVEMASAIWAQQASPAALPLLPATGGGDKAGGSSTPFPPSALIIHC